MSKKNLKWKVMIIVILLIIPAVVIALISSRNTVRPLLNQYFYENNIKTSDLDNEDSNIRAVVYNGITIEDGIKSNSIIEKKAEKITKDAKNDREKAKKLYSWIGANIEYDNNKADKILNTKEEVLESGAIYAFRDRSGVCFDYACLYVAMARSINLKVRLVIGEAYDGNQYVSHAWNEVYLADEGIWIKIDTTFYIGGNYFDSDNFDKHISKEVVGEW
ncbi:MAG: transglutaminase domain-containing protein [Clostridium butyricum]|nr:transglutaminase domain-containing protein [Clostridium butyricum]